MAAHLCAKTYLRFLLLGELFLLEFFITTVSKCLLMWELLAIVGSLFITECGPELLHMKKCLEATYAVIWC